MTARSSETTIAARYATAIFSLAEDAGMETEIVTAIAALGDVIAENQALKDALANPLVTRAEKIAIIAAIAKKSDALTQNALRTVAEQGRTELLPIIAQSLLAKLAAKNDVLTAEIESARPLSPAIQKQLTASLEKATGKKVALNITENPSLLGGVAIQIGSKRLDASLAAALNTMRGQLLAAGNA
jgi:F-type H+-transporting ATPase subunit delta